MAMLITKVTLLGDSGEYDIQVDPVTMAARCTCPAYRFAKGVKLCKHISFLADVLSPE